MEKNLELFSGKFFVKVVHEDIVYSDGSGSSADNIITTAQQPTYWLADVQAPAIDEGHGNGIIHAQFNTSMPTADVENIHGAGLTNREPEWASVESQTGRSFFIDNMYMAAGQISDDNYARNAGQTWVGSCVEYPLSPIWGGLWYEGHTIINANASGTDGWLHLKNNRGTWPNLATNPEFGVNGLEGIMTSEAHHTGQTPLVDNWRTWKKDTGTGFWNASDSNEDKTYGPDDAT